MPRAAFTAEHTQLWIYIVENKIYKCLIKIGNKQEFLYSNDMVWSYQVTVYWLSACGRSIIITLRSDWNGWYYLWLMQPPPDRGHIQHYTLTCRQTDRQMDGQTERQTGTDSKAGEGIKQVINGRLWRCCICDRHIKLTQSTSVNETQLTICHADNRVCLQVASASATV